MEDSNMLDIQNITIDGMEFQLVPLPILKAARLDKKVISILTPVLGTVKSLDDEIDLGKVIDEEYEKFIIDLCSTVTCHKPGQPPVQLMGENINELFKGALKTLYKLMYEVMKYNKFSPFALMADSGNLTTIMSLFAGQEETTKEDGKELETSEN
jgi:hypothetical protein